MWNLKEEKKTHTHLRWEIKTINEKDGDDDDDDEEKEETSEYTIQQQ